MGDSHGLLTRRVRERFLVNLPFLSSSSIFIANRPDHPRRVFDLIFVPVILEVLDANLCWLPPVGCHSSDHLFLAHEWFDPLAVLQALLIRKDGWRLDAELTVVMKPLW